MSALLELADRCEQATGPDRDLNADIIRAALEMVDWITVPDFTASLDAAITLVPEGWRIAAICEREPWFCRVETRDFDSVTWGKGENWITDIVAGQEASAKGVSAALALCAAALRARDAL